MKRRRPRSSSSVGCTEMLMFPAALVSVRSLATCLFQSIACGVRVCGSCSSESRHEEQVFIPTVPNLLCLRLDRNSSGGTLFVEESVRFPIIGDFELHAVVYKRWIEKPKVYRYSTACRGPQASWWYYDCGKTPLRITDISRVLSSAVSLLVYTPLSAAYVVASGTSGSSVTLTSFGSPLHSVSGSAPTQTMP